MIAITLATYVSHAHIKDMPFLDKPHKVTPYVKFWGPYVTMRAFMLTHFSFLFHDNKQNMSRKISEERASVI